MNFSIIFSIILVILGIITSISGSELFWWIIILFPIVVVINIFPRFRITENNIKAILIIGGLGFIFTMTLLSEGVFNFGSIIIFIYLLLIFMVLGKILGKNKGIYSLIIIVGIIISGLLTSIIDDYMSGQEKISIEKQAADDKIIKDKLDAIKQAKKMNASGTTNTGMNNQSITGVISTGASYPLIIQ